MNVGEPTAGVEPGEATPTTDQTAPPAVMVPQGGRIGYDLMKSHLFRVIYADGVYGGLSPAGQIRMTLFNERYAIPTHMEHALSPHGHVGEEDLSARVCRSNIVRELEADVVMNLETAKLLHSWLNDKISQLEEVLKSVKTPQR